MVSKSKVEWTGSALNPLRFRNHKTKGQGHYCEKISKGCAGCYAESMQKVFFKNDIRYNRADLDKGELYLDEAALEKVEKRRKPETYFVCSMTDIFGDWVKQEWIDRIFQTFERCPQHTFQVLTKRSDRIALMWPDFKRHENVWLGASMEDQEEVENRMFNLLACRALTPCLWVSAEPLLGPLNFNRIKRDSSHTYDAISGVIRDRNRKIVGRGGDTIDWIVLGGESGQKARFCNVDWISDVLLRNANSPQCKLFVKQLGRKPYTNDEGLFQGTQYVHNRDGDFASYKVRLKNDKGGDPTEWPESLNHREYPQCA